jgi:tetratricopeptide (TPR) repeat protein
MIERAHAVAGWAFTPAGEMVSIPQENRLPTLLPAPPEENDWATLARWLALPSDSRPVTPNSPLTYRQLAERERDTMLKEGLVSALRTDPTVPLARLFLAALESDRARVKFLREYELRHLPDDPALWARASLSLAEQKQFEPAIQAAQKALSLDPTLAAAHRSLAAALQAAGQKEKAMEAYEKLITNTNTEFGDFIDAGYLAARLGRADQARAIFRDAKQNYPKIPGIVRMEGWALINLQSPAEALDAFQRYASMVDPNVGPNPNGVSGLAVSRWLTGDKDGAVADYERAIRLAPSLANADAIQRSAYADVERTPLLEVLAETLKRHPELAPKPSPTPDK